MTKVSNVIPLSQLHSLKKKRKEQKQASKKSSYSDDDISFHDLEADDPVPTSTDNTLSKKEEAAIEVMEGVDALEPKISSFQKQYKKLKASLDRSDEDEHDVVNHILILKSLLHALLTLTACSELAMKRWNNDKSASQFKIISELLLTVLNDLKLLQSSSKQVDAINELLKNGITLAVQNLVDGSNLLKKSLVESVKDAKVKKTLESKIDDFTTKQGSSLQAVYQLLESQITELFKSGRHR